MVPVKICQKHISIQGTLFRETLSTVDFLVLIGLNQLLFILKALFVFLTKQAALIWRATVLKSSPSVGFPRSSTSLFSENSLLQNLRSV